MAAEAGGARAGGLTRGGVGALAVFLLAALAAFAPASASWLFLAAAAAFEAWLFRRIAAEGHAPAASDEPPYYFSVPEGELVGRYRIYFGHPKAARDFASVLAALGLCSLLLCPWLTYQRQFLPAVLLALNVLAAGRLTREVAPRLTVRTRELHDAAWDKIRAGNRAG